MFDDEDELIIPPYCANMVLGTTAHRDTDSEGALNFRQFLFGKVDAAALSYVGPKKN